MVAESCRMGFVIQIDSLSSILDSLAGLNFFYESFIVKESKDPFLGSSSSFHTEPDTKGTPPFFDKHALFNLKVKLERDEDLHTRL